MRRRRTKERTGLGDDGAFEAIVLNTQHTQHSGTPRDRFDAIIKKRIANGRKTGGVTDSAGDSDEPTSEVVVRSFVATWRGGNDFLYK